MKRKICIISGTRADYGLLYWTIKGIAEDEDVALQLCVTGMHLSTDFGLTYKEIENDGFHIDRKVEILLASDSEVSISKSIGLGIISFSEVFNQLKPDIILLLGDRFEMLAVATAATIAKIPIAHCHGGELTQGAFDDSFRHSITKMSHLHFTSTEVYKKRVIQLGEQPDRVFNVGALGIENINRLKLLKKKELEKVINPFAKYNILVTYHPVTLETDTSKAQFKELLKAVDQLKDIHIIFTKPNADTNGKILIDLIDSYVQKNPEKAISFVSMGQLKYLSALKHVDVVLGNSSSGIIEAPSLKTATINIGDRQEGRIKAESIIDCEPNYLSITDALQKVLSENFQSKTKNVENPYGKQNASDQIIPILKSYNLEGILKKNFFDLP